jgi:hypothetical protein
MYALIQKIAAQAEIADNPPVLMDIGASAGLNPIWKHIAHFCVCIAFDADDRDFTFTEKEQSDFRRLIVYNSIATDGAHRSKQDFYLTKSPYCSSTLMPDTEGLKHFAFADLFTVEQKIQLNAVQPCEILKETNLSQVDWFKSDTQGTDLRLFKNLPLAMQQRAIVVQMEPGIIDAYLGEDKMVDCVQYMRTLPFITTEMTVKGSIHLAAADFNALFPTLRKQKIARHVLKNTAGWTELTFANRFDAAQDFGLREYLLGWLFNALQGQYATAYTIAQLGHEHLDNALLLTLKNHAAQKLKADIYGIKTVKAALQKYF